MLRWRKDRSKGASTSDAARERVTGCWRSTAGIDAFGATDRGRVRSSNQDQFLLADLDKTILVDSTSLPEPAHRRLFAGSSGKLFVVADGMGGHRGGEEASSIAVATVLDYVLNSLPWCFRLADGGVDDFEADLQAAVRSAQKAVEERARTVQGLRGMGTTLTMAYLIGERLFVVHVGDSRCYLERDGILQQITTDHTVAQKLVEQGTLAPSEVRTSRFSHMLWNSIGGGDGALRVDVIKVPIEAGDRLLLCTDGIPAHVEDADLVRVLARSASAEDAVRELIALANERGGSDNMAVIVARIEDET